MGDAASGECLHTFQGHRVESAAFSPDGQRVVTASGGGTAKLWDAASGECLYTFQDHESFVFSAAFSSDGQRVVTGAGDGTAKLWDAASGMCFALSKAIRTVLSLQLSRQT